MYHRRLLAMSILMVAVVSACSSVSRYESGGLTTEALIPVTDFEPGDCFDDPSASEVEEVPGLPCEVPHDNEVYAIFDHENSAQPWPGPDALDEYAYFSCLDRFDAYVGAAYVDSQLDVSFFTPLEDGWNNGDHEIVCFLYDLEFVKLTASMQGSGQ